MKTKQKVLFWMSILLLLLIFLAYLFIRYNNQIESLTSLSEIKMKQKELEEQIVKLNQQLVKLNQQKKQLEDEVKNLSETVNKIQQNMNFRTLGQNTIQIKNMNQTLSLKQNEIKTIDANIDKTTNEINKTSKEIEILKRIIAEPFDIIINDITNYPEGFVKPNKNSFIMNSIMSGMPDIVSESYNLEIGNNQSVTIANDSKTNTIIAISPVKGNSFPQLFTIDIKYNGDKNIWSLYTADKNSDFMPNYQYNNEILEINNFSSKFLHNRNTYEINNKNIKMANVDLGNKIMSITTTGDVLDKNNNTYAKVEMSIKGMKIEFLNDKETISGIVIILSPKIESNPNE